MDKIGSGSYGVVYKVLRKADRMVYAMKEIDLAGMSRKEQEECIRETRVLSSLDSDYIIKYYDSFLERGKLYIITEYAGNGNLHDYIKKQKQRLHEDLIWKLFVQILLGLNHMHSRKILHRDIKTLNVFLDDGLNVKLGDMGVAKILSSNTNFAKTIVGTPYYLSPELCEDKPYNEKSDVWALGVVLYECCTQKHPFDADNQGALILKILRGKYPALTGYSPDISDLVKRCLTQNANRRPNTFKLLLLSSIRQKSEELGVPIPDQQTLIAMAEKLAFKRPGSSRAKAADVPDAALLSADAGLPAAGGEDALGATMPRARPQEDAAPSGQADAEAVVQKMRALGVADDEEGGDDEDGPNPYDNPYGADRDEGDGSYDGEAGEEDEDGEYAEGEEDGEYYDEEYGEEEGGEDRGFGLAREEHMKGALMIQKAACLEMIGQDAYNQLYELLKGNQVDEASMTDLSRLVFKIIPYDKSEVIQMMYKLLYLESQLEAPA